VLSQHKNWLPILVIGYVSLLNTSRC
jgi:hypothetical protein